MNSYFFALSGSAGSLATSSTPPSDSSNSGDSSLSSSSSLSSRTSFVSLEGSPRGFSSHRPLTRPRSPGHDPAQTPPKRPRLAQMQDHVPGTSSSGSVAHASSGRSVASRLKKSLTVVAQPSEFQNGCSHGGPEKVENGMMEMSAGLELSPADQELVRLIGQHLKNLGLS